MGHYTTVLTFYRSLGKNDKNILKGEYQKDGIKYEDQGGGGGGWGKGRRGGGDTSTIPITILQCSYTCDFLHMIFSTCT